jgi:HEPN domain-containing protein
MHPSATPAGFILDAVTFLAAAEFTLNRATGPSLPAYFLFARSIELCLKAFLLESGVTAKALSKRPFGHDLSALHREAVARNLGSRITLSSIEVGVIELLSAEYIETKLGYRVTGETYYLPLIEITEQVARKLVHVSNPIKDEWIE